MSPPPTRTPAPPPAMRAVFLSYRRDDTPTVTGVIHHHLTAPTGFGPDGVFMDIDDIPPGVDFREVIDDTVGACRFFLAVIGPRWVTSRLQHPGDFVRLEIEAALRRGIPLVPVLVDGATMPKPEELPESLRPLVFLHATSLRSGAKAFAEDIERLMKGLHKAEEWKKWKAGGGAAVSLIGAEQKPVASPAQPARTAGDISDVAINPADDTGEFEIPENFDLTLDEADEDLISADFSLAIDDAADEEGDFYETAYTKEYLEYLQSIDYHDPTPSPTTARKAGDRFVLDVCF